MVVAVLVVVVAAPAAAVRAGARVVAGGTAGDLLPDAPRTAVGAGAERGAARAARLSFKAVGGRRTASRAGHPLHGGNRRQRRSRAVPQRGEAARTAHRTPRPRRGHLPAVPRPAHQRAAVEAPQ